MEAQQPFYAFRKRIVENRGGSMIEGTGFCWEMSLYYTVNIMEFQNDPKKDPYSSVGR